MLIYWAALSSLQMTLCRCASNLLRKHGTRVVVQRMLCAWLTTYLALRQLRLPLASHNAPSHIPREGGFFDYFLSAETLPETIWPTRGSASLYRSLEASHLFTNNLHRWWWVIKITGRLGWWRKKRKKGKSWMKSVHVKLATVAADRLMFLAPFFCPAIGLGMSRH